MLKFLKKMKVEIKTLGFLRQYLPKQYRREPVFFSFKNPVSLDYLVFSVLAMPRQETIAMVNNRYVTHGYILKDGDQVTVLPPVDGG